MLVSLATLLLGLPPSFADAPQSSGALVSGPDMKRICDADQADRSGDFTKIDWAVVGPRDAERRQETRRLLADGRLHTGADFLEAAFVFQHGGGDDAEVKVAKAAFEAMTPLQIADIVDQTKAVAQSKAQDRR